MIGQGHMMYDVIKIVIDHDVLQMIHCKSQFLSTQQLSYLE